MAAGLDARHLLCVIPTPVRHGLIGLLALTACETKSRPPNSPDALKRSINTRQLMEEVMEPAANIYWESVGSVTDRNGTVDKAPKTEAEWIAVRNAATVVASGANLLMLDPPANGREEWVRLARALVAEGERARAVAESRDPKAVFDAGADLYQACVDCHSIYLVGDKATARP